MNEAAAVLVQHMTDRAVDVATRGRGSRVTAANHALAFLLRTSRFCETDGVITIAENIRKSRGQIALEHLKHHGTISVEETGFAEQSFKTYQSYLIRLQWITVEDGKWIWCGPETARWSEVTQLRKHKT
jgi:hypothetical protein